MSWGLLGKIEKGILNILMGEREKERGERESKKCPLYPDDVQEDAATSSRSLKPSLHALKALPLAFISVRLRDGD